MSKNALMPLNGPGDLKELAKVFVNSGLFGSHAASPDELTVKVAQAQVKILAGSEYGLSPFVAMRAMHVVDGKPVPSYQMIAGLIQASSRFKYEVVESSDERCEIKFFERDIHVPPHNWELLGTSKWDREDTKKAGLTNKDNWRKYERQMNFSRALTNGANIYTPSIFGGAIYTPDDLGIAVDATGVAVVDENGEPVKDTEAKSAPKKTGGKTSAATAAATTAEPTPTPTPATATSNEDIVDVDPKPVAADAEAPIVTAGTVAADPKPGAAQSAESSPATDAGTASDQQKSTPAGAPDASKNSKADSTTSTTKDAGRTGRPGKKELVELLQAGEKVGLDKNAVNALLMEHLLTDGGFTQENVNTFIHTWTWADYDSVMAKVQAAKK